MGLTSALHTALFGLSYNQKQIDVTAANVANANVAGYTTKSVSAHVYFDNGGNVSGILSTEIRRQVNEAIQSAYWGSLADANYSKTVAAYTERLDEIFGTIDNSSSLPSLMSDLTAGLSTLVNTPDSYAARQEVLSVADTLARQLNSSYELLQSMRQETDSLIRMQVGEVNQLLGQIELIDEKIEAAKAVGANTANLVDQRDRYLEQLSGYADISITQDGSGGLQINTRNGQMLYGDGHASSLSFDPTGTLGAGQPGGGITVTTYGGTRYDLGASSSSGSLMALLELRDDALVQAQAQLDEIAAQLSLAFSNVTVASEDATDGTDVGYELDLSGLQPGNTVSLRYVDSAGTTQTVTFVAVEDPSLLPLDGATTPTAGDTVYGIDISGGVPAGYVTQIIAALSATDLNVSDDGLGNLVVLGDTGTNTVVSSLSGNVTVTDPANQGLGLALFVDAGNGMSLYTGALEGGGQKTGFAGSIRLNPAVINDPSQLVIYETVPAANSGKDSSRPQYLLDALATTTITFDPAAGIGSGGDPFKGTMLDYVNQVVAFQGEQSEKAVLTSQAHETITSNLAIRYEESYAVDVDAELAFLIELQNAYAANARVMQAAKEMFDVLLNSV
ncbi:flagellar hook-associated protein FlgK [Polymorphum gilvum]|uniref:Flagellar hook-associated protein 1 n=1 Tax=Polymorphum gilvum (strain LMG 25793 / CGMCC 1.9160 / SL003B-26A1) TaxID=991905 RepID=F2J423_POLGS|nr:flagellar hook-associated protein FlgK [Polymorphum gilvum]ADZ69949.1 Flagellar hook-associated protein FlgK [Polymorphum gilvum SL003B-26A1]